MTVKTQGGKVITKGGKVSCECCEDAGVVVKFQYASISQDCEMGTCGFLPCETSEENVCIPNYNDLSEEEKCFPQLYLTQTFAITDTREGSSEYDDGGDPPQETVSASYNYSSSDLVITTYNIEDCTTTEENSCEGSCSFTSTRTDGPLSSTDGYSLQRDSENCDRWFGEEFICNGEFTDEVDGDSSFCTPFYIGCLGDAQVFEEDIVSQTTITTTYSNPTPPICTPEELPEYPEYNQCVINGSYQEPLNLSPGQGYSSEAYNFTNPNNSDSVNKTNVKFRVRHSNSLSGYLRIWFRKKIQKWKLEDCAWVVDGAITTEDFGTYTWTDESEPSGGLEEGCEGLIYSTEDKFLIAGQNESVTVEIKFTDIEDFEPDW